MQAKPIVTYAGNKELFENVGSQLVCKLPDEPVEWRRSHGRCPRPVHIDSLWQPFDSTTAFVQRDRLLNRQYMHTFWTDCSDVDEYKGRVKNEIVSWMNTLKEKNAWDWLIIVVEENSGRKTPAKTTSKLLKSTVWDRIKADFPSKNIERCATFVRQVPSGSRSADSKVLSQSESQFLVQLRQTVLHALNREITYFEERLREKREARNQPGWSFIDFYFMQEELACVLESLSLYDDALIQYDELDALLTQFIINAASSECPTWLTDLTDCKTSWTALCLKNSQVNNLKKELFLHKKASLLDLRNYLFVRICSILILLCRPWEMAQRALPYIQNAVLELKTLEIEMTYPGAVETWALAGFLEILYVSERYNDSSQVESYSLHTAELWAHARMKLKTLGELCGLMPHMTPTSEQIHLVVSLLSGMGDDPRANESDTSPYRRISESLSSKESFVKQYKDVCEIAMGTFKHVGRIRSARLIGKDLAQFYLQKDEPQMAVQFLQDLLKVYLLENWTELAVLTQKDLLRCYKLLSYDALYLQTALVLAINPCLSRVERSHYFDDVLATKERIPKNKNVTFGCRSVFRVDNATVKSETEVLTLNSSIVLQLELYSNLLAEVKMKKIIVACEPFAPPNANSEDAKRKNLAGLIKPPPAMAVVRSASIGIICSNQHQVLSRQDSASGQSVATSGQDILRVKSDVCFSATNIYIAPGKNLIDLPLKVNSATKYELKQICLEWDQLCFVENLSTCQLPKNTFEIIEEKCSVNFQVSTQPLMCGKVGSVKLTLTAGSQSIDEGQIINITSPTGLILNDSSNKTTITMEKQLDPFASVSYDLRVFSDFANQSNNKPIEHEIICHSLDEDAKDSSIKLTFVPPFLAHHKVHTCDQRKFIQVVVEGLCKQLLNIDHVSLTCPNSHITLTALSEVEPVALVEGVSSSFLWEVVQEPEGDCNPYNQNNNARAISREEELHFSASYMWLNNDENRNQTNGDFVAKPSVFTYSFKVSSLLTLFSVNCHVESLSHGYCKVDAVCNLNIKILKLFDPDIKQLYYEIVADSSMWAIIGKSSDVFSFENNAKEFNCTIEVKPLTRGFLPVPQLRILKYIKENNQPRLESLQPGEVYNWSRGSQAHVPIAATGHPDNFK